MFTNYSRNSMLNAVNITHTGAAETFTGAELSGGTYSRATTPFGTASNLSKVQTSVGTIEGVAASRTLRWLVGYDALSGGNELVRSPIGSSQNSFFEFTVRAATDMLEVPNHSFVTNDTVTLLDSRESLPSGITQGNIYYIINYSSDSLQISDTSGGATVNVTVDGDGIISPISELPTTAVSEVVISAGTVA